jgi:hypothetical protein
VLQGGCVRRRRRRLLVGLFSWEGGKDGGRERGERDGETKKGMSDADAPQSRKKRGELRAGAPARKIREEGRDGGRMGRGRKRRRKREEG